MTTLGSPFCVINKLNEFTQINCLHSKRQINTKFYKYYFEENLNDNVHKVVIDAGHGGHDPGCQGKHSYEKDIALKIALQTGALLNNKNSDIEVIFTRTADIFIPLHKRIALANEKKADVFISIHCNYVGNPKVCGTETFVMGLHKAEENLNVAKRENASVLLEDDYETNYEGYDPNSPVGHILLSMFQNLHLDQSIALANDIENKFSNRKNIHSRGVKQAGFVVLRQATMPSILIETGFLSNPKEEEYLMSKNGQLEIATAIYTSLTSYFKTNDTNIDRKKITKDIKAPMTDEVYTIQIGVYSNNKEKLMSGTAFANEIDVSPVGDLYRYTIGSFGDRSTAKRTLNKIQSLGIHSAYIRKVTN